MKYRIRSCEAYDAQLVEILSDLYKMDQDSAVNYFLTAFVLEVKPPKEIAIRLLTKSIEYGIEGADVVFEASDGDR